jgi:predicted DNA-binding protein (UPF0251 family)
LASKIDCATAGLILIADTELKTLTKSPEMFDIASAPDNEAEGNFVPDATTHIPEEHPPEPCAPGQITFDELERLCVITDLRIQAATRIQAVCRGWSQRKKGRFPKEFKAMLEESSHKRRDGLRAYTRKLCE